MTLTITDEQRKDLAAILSTHRHNMSVEMTNAHDDPAKSSFYRAAFDRVEALSPLFAEAPSADHDEDDDPEGE